MPNWAVVLIASVSRIISALIARVLVRRGVKKEVKAEILEKDTVKQEKAIAKAYREKKDSSGLSDSDVADRLRRRSDDWGRL